MGLFHTLLLGDGDPIDVLIVSQAAVVRGAVVRCRPVGVLMMEDEAGPDEKIIAVPVESAQSVFQQVRHLRGFARYPTRPDRAFFCH